MAAEAGDGGGHSNAVAGNVRFALAELRPVGGGAAGHGYFCRVLAARRAIEGREEAEVDSLDGGGGGAIDVSGVAGFRDHGDEAQWNFLRADGGALDRIAVGAGADFSLFGAWAGAGTIGSAGD